LGDVAGHQPGPAVRLRASGSLQPVAAARAQHCNAACGDRGLKCHAPDFWFLNSCEKLAEYFPCEVGLGGWMPAEPRHVIHRVIEPSCIELCDILILILILRRG